MENSYEQLIDDYNNGILVEAGESLTDYINRMGGVKKANGGIITALRIGLANGSLSPDELAALEEEVKQNPTICLLYTSPSPRDRTRSRMPSSA